MYKIKKPGPEVIRALTRNLMQAAKCVAMSSQQESGCKDSVSVEKLQAYSY